LLIEVYFQQVHNLIEFAEIVESFPHRKHDGSEDNVVSSDAPFLADVLKKIERIQG
jgi:hypothetical protein